MERVSLTELIAAAAIIIALVGFVLDLQNREEDRVNRAWSLAPKHRRKCPSEELAEPANLVVSNESRMIPLWLAD